MISYLISTLGVHFSLTIHFSVQSYCYLLQSVYSKPQIYSYHLPRTVCISQVLHETCFCFLAVKIQPLKHILSSKSPIYKPYLCYMQIDSQDLDPFT